MDPSEAPLWGQIIARVDWTQVLLVILGGLASWLAVKYRAKLREWRALWAGVLAGLRAIPEMQADIAKVKTAVEGISYYVRPNGGGSLSDKADRTEKAAQAAAASIAAIAGTIRAESDADRDTARFDASEAGGNTYVNATYASWIDVSREQLLGFNFLNYVHPDDVRRVSELWKDCREQGRQYRVTHRMVTSGGEVISVRVVATVIPDAPESQRWVGVIHKIDAATPLHMREDNGA